jgi:hypothetical protein
MIQTLTAHKLGAKIKIIYHPPSATTPASHAG